MLGYGETSVCGDPECKGCYQDVKKKIDEDSERFANELVKNIESAIENSFKPITGVWFVYGYDMHAYPVYIAADEADANRFVVKSGIPYNVKFWEFGTEW